MNPHYSDFSELAIKKIAFFREVLQKVILNVQQNKKLNILGASDITACMHSINLVHQDILKLTTAMITESQDSIISRLQIINNDISRILKTYGSSSIEDVITICFGSIKDFIDVSDMTKFEIIKAYFHPTNYIVETHDKKTKNLTCADVSLSPPYFHEKIYGIKINILHKDGIHNIIIHGILDDVVLDYIDNSFINDKKKHVQIPDGISHENLQTYKNYISALSLKDYIIYSIPEIRENYTEHLNYYGALKQKSINQLIKDFITSSLYLKRNILIHLLLNDSAPDNKYIAYLLYDIMSNTSDVITETYTQILVFDSFPWYIKTCFKDNMNQIIKYTESLSTHDTPHIPLEQQICLMKAPDNVKERAMSKLKEIKSKTDESGSKAQHYLNGLLKIPFGIYKKEPILHIMHDIKSEFATLMRITGEGGGKTTFTNIEIMNYLQGMSTKPDENIFSNWSKADLTEKYYEICKIYNIIPNKLAIKTKQQVKAEILGVVQDDVSLVHKILNVPDEISIGIDIMDKFKTIKQYINNITPTLNTAVYGHTPAKKQIERIIAQWINGEQDGHCFGFEGPPGVGKTSLAVKGIAECLKDEYGVSRPFSLIQIGGDSNGSTIHGHNYTYVGATWGNIAQILMDSACMNPIIFIDELDKISRTETGKEIVGILTHLLDSSQNNKFQDKYFSGIDLNLSRALFVISYNDVSLIDKTLLDRIHRIKFDSLTLEDKLVISEKYLLPEICKKFGLENMIHIDKETLSFIVENYTCEPGVRKLKEKLFEIVGEINIEFLKNMSCSSTPYIHVGVEDIKNKYFKHIHIASGKHANPENVVGVANGMWANSLGQGGIIPIQCKFIPSENFLKLKLTGLQGDVMKESMSIALTLAWNLTEPSRQIELRESMRDYGIHVHTPDGSVQKDGPSAGGCVTVALFSLLNNKKIKPRIAMTGEISLDGSITAIGGLESKILGAIKEDIVEFIYPAENMKDLELFLEKHIIPSNIIFHKVRTIQDALKIIIVD
jgi:ATP-dependent Lon protease